MDLFEHLSQDEREKVATWLQESIDDDFRCQSVNRAIGSQYFQDVSPTMPGFNGGVDVSTLKVTVNMALLR